MQRLRELEAIVDGLDDLVSEDRAFHRYDLVLVNVSPLSVLECEHRISVRADALRR